MPALTSYSPYETLVFFQNVVRHGADTSALQQISTTLNENQLIRECDSYDPTKFTPEALLYLYNRVISVRDNATGNHVNGGDTPNGDHNPKKRKISPVSTPNRSRGQDDQGFLRSFVDNLYASFRKETIEELRREEEQYAKLQQDIADLETRIEDEQKQTANGASETAAPSPTPSRPVVQIPPKALADKQAASVPPQAALEVPLSKPQSQARLSPQPVPSVHSPIQQDRAHPSPIPAARSVTPHSGAGTPHPPPPPQLANQPPPNSSPAAFHRSVPSPSPSRGAQPPLPAPHGYPPPHHQPYPPHMLPPHASMQRVPSPGEYPPMAPSQSRGSPLPYQSQPHYPHHQMYPNGPPQWQPPPNQQYAPPYGTPQYYPPQAQNRPPPHMQTPQQQPYMIYPQTAPMPYPPPRWRGPPPVQFQNHPVSASTTPVPRSGSQSALIRSTNSTPWKTKPSATDLRTRSPSRDERDVSPISAPGSPPPSSVVENEPTKREEKSPAPHIDEHKQDDNLQVSQSAASRSQSVVSATSEGKSEAFSRKARPSKIKPEPPSTPVLLVSDSEQKSSGRRVRPRGNTATAKPELPRTATTIKRKRESITSRSPSPAPVGPPTTNQRTSTNRVDRTLVMVSRNFAKTCQMLLNEITSHKLAGIFAKPLTERDAPGYKDLILLPQDLKSIKTAVSKGSKAANIAIDELESKGYEDEDDSHRTTEGPVGNGFYMVPKNEDLLPPKSIVNSAQLETELVRIFANAIMFNPLTDAERGFGRNLRLRRRGGETAAARRTRRATTADTVGTGATSTGEESATDSAAMSDEGGIIADTREFFNDVIEIVSKWRQLEGASMTGSTSGNSLATPHVGGTAEGTRHTSVSASSANENQEDEAGHDATPSANTGTSRKRRKVGEHL